MQQLIKIIVLTILSAIMLLSCKSEESIQTYIVEHQDLPDYKAIDISAKIVDFSKAELTEEQEETLGALEKLNFLLYRAKKDDLESYKTELAKVRKVFKNENHSELMEFSSNGTKFKVSAIGDDNTVDEILVLASSSEFGFGLLRVLGDDMNPEKMVGLISKLQNADVDDSQLKGIMDFFKS
jgi:hypothetical protein